MNKLNILIEDHLKSDKSRNSVSNLIKKIKLETEFYSFVDNYVEFGCFKQKLYHYMNNLKDCPICPVCCVNNLNWVNGCNYYRSTCSIKCAGKLTGTKNRPKRESHPVLNSNSEFISYFNTNKIKLTESNLLNVYPNLVGDVNIYCKFETIWFSEKVYFYLYELNNKPTCNHCKYNPVEFDTFSKGYHTYCSVKCSSNSDKKKNDIINTCLDKYGVENIGSVTREKASSTMYIRYGGHISTTEQYKEKYKATSLLRYGKDHYFKTYEFKENMSSLFMEKYGVNKVGKIPGNSDKMLITKKLKGLIYKWTETELKDIQSYRRSVCYYTELNYEKYKDVINPNGLDRGVYSNHIDHIYPVIEGWRNKIPPKELSHWKNLRLIDSYDNLAKGERTELRLEDFYELIKE